MQEVSDALPVKPMMTRRMFGVSAACCFAAPLAFAAPSEYYGCCISKSDTPAQLPAQNAILAYSGLDTGSGDAVFDRALAQTLVLLSERFQVLPGFAFFQEESPQARNAYASASNSLGRDDGDVKFGRYLFSEIMVTREAPEIGIASVCAHEFGHIVQYKYGIYERLIGPDRRSKRLELHADFLAGYFSGLRRLERRSFPAAVIATTQAAKGDTSFGSITHHGTARERGDAVVAGYQTAYDHKRNLGEAIEVGIGYVMQIPFPAR